MHCYLTASRLISNKAPKQNETKNDKAKPRRSTSLRLQAESFFIEGIGVTQESS